MRAATTTCSWPSTSPMTRWCSATPPRHRLTLLFLPSHLLQPLSKSSVGSKQDPLPLIIIHNKPALHHHHHHHHLHHLFLQQQQQQQQPLLLLLLLYSHIE